MWDGGQSQGQKPGGRLQAGGILHLPGSSAQTSGRVPGDSDVAVLTFGQEDEGARESLLTSRGISWLHWQELQPWVRSREPAGYRRGYFSLVPKSALFPSLVWLRLQASVTWLPFGCPDGPQGL